ncbi:hypothetical protein [Streptomyces sp. UG1]|uniref:hypothetical protein n=1 Tax=Streptomyces sp. UG1 TaxID=3417652 RepID=UPI003CF880E3
MSKERFVHAGVFDNHGSGRGLRLFGRFNVGVEDLLWSRLSTEARAEVDGLIAAGRSVQAIAVMRECAGLPRPGLHECVDLLAQRFAVMRE